MGKVARKSEIILYQTKDGKTKLEVRQYFAEGEIIGLLSGVMK